MGLKQWFKNNFIEDNSVEPKMYLILREDLTYKYIQGAHALSEFAIDYPELFRQWGNRYLICLSVFNGIALDEFKHRIDEEYCKSLFYEPDLGNKLTAIAIFEDGDGDVSNLVSKLRLATK